MRFRALCLLAASACITTAAVAQSVPRHELANPAAGVDEKWEYTPPDENVAEGRKKALELLPKGTDKLVFIKRKSFTANHYYTEYINSHHNTGTNISILDLKTGKVKDILPKEFAKAGIIARMDVNYDADKVVFDYKNERDNGYRLWEIKLDGTGLRQILAAPKDEARIVEKYRKGYHHGTDDMHPCYLPDGDICFVSTRCQYGILCDAPDIFSTTILYRMKPDGSGLRPLSNSSVSEQAPSVTPDGRIIYSRWEYVNKGGSTVKCIWSMRPDGTASAEVYGNNVALPATMNYPRAIPGSTNQYVMLAAPHMPGNYGAIVRLDMKKDIRSIKPMTYMTPYTDARGEYGWSFRASSNAGWKGTGKLPLFTDPYPLSDKYFLVSHKPGMTQHNEATGYGLYLLDEHGKSWLIHKEEDTSCFMPYPLRKRQRPTGRPSIVNEALAKKDQAVCVVTDVYHGMENTARGDVKYLRVLEQVPRPWSSRRFWPEGSPEQEHAAISLTHLGLKVQHGVVPVEKDGSAHFVVPANKNIFFQALDKDYRMIQDERTYVNYMPGETRACIGCHETPDQGAPNMSPRLIALRRSPSKPGPQLGEKQGNRPLDFMTDVQPVFDKHCVKCHNNKEKGGDLDLRGEMTNLFTVSYEQLIKGGVMPLIREVRPKCGNAAYLPAKSVGSYNSILAMVVTDGALTPPEMTADRKKKLLDAHKDMKLTPAEALRITNFIDTNAQFYGTYYGRKGIKYKDHPNFRPTPSWKSAIGIQTVPDEER